MQMDRERAVLEPRGVLPGDEEAVRAGAAAAVLKGPRSCSAVPGRPREGALWPPECASATTSRHSRPPSAAPTSRQVNWSVSGCVPGFSQEASATWLSTNWFRTIRSTSPQYSGWPLLASVTPSPTKSIKAQVSQEITSPFRPDDLGQETEPGALRADVAVERIDPAEQHGVFHVQGVVGCSHQRPQVAVHVAAVGQENLLSGVKSGFSSKTSLTRPRPGPGRASSPSAGRRSSAT